MIRRILASALLVAARTAGAQGIVGAVADSATDEPLRCVDVALVPVLPYHFTIQGG